MNEKLYAAATGRFLTSMVLFASAMMSRQSPIDDMKHITGSPDYPDWLRYLAQELLIKIGEK